ncbi:hypothetical protein J4E93_000294 [Alternaria ventricosa]|uniref:uncharacterized protein n=1 Tax=Alternaria ventricosa TaxID=1187951 RepID=UPI0020C40FE3|nr:uncharacterized protein J4E93_000294 [Alternaria ventricosa]KAI4655580.1 hypothetical protein J4E93_000294 [Alternaria ventricosa]
MNGNWEESKTRIINLPDDHPGTFALYISFIYTGQRPVTDKTAQELKMLSEDEFSKLTTAQYKAVFNVLILAEKLQDLKIKNAMMEAAVATALLRGPDGDWFVPSSCVINNIYRGTPPKSPARRFVTDAWIGCSISENFAIISRLNKDFVEDLGKGIDKHWVPVRMQATFQSTIWNAAAYQEKSNED